MDDILRERPDPILLEIRGEMYKYRWPDTGEEFYATVSYSPGRLPDREDVGLILVVSQNSGVAEQIATARRLFPSLQNRPVAELMGEVKEHGTIVLGAFHYWDTPHIIQDAKVEGIEVRISGLSGKE